MPALKTRALKVQSYLAGSGGMPPPPRNFLDLTFNLFCWILVNSEAIIKFFFTIITIKFWPK